MVNKNLDSQIHELRELRRMADELAAEIDTIQDAIKREMEATGVDRKRLEGHLEERHQQPHRHRRPEEGPARSGGTVHQDQHRPAVQRCLSRTV